MAEQVFAAAGQRIEYQVGTMIELPRAALLADRIAIDADFLRYVESGIFEKDPFVSLDRDGVGLLVQIAVEKGRATKPKLKLGICGERGGDPASIAFCREVGLNYVSGRSVKVFQLHGP
jgi:pyruvate, orthophosphate dikinase